MAASEAAAAEGQPTAARSGAAAARGPGAARARADPAVGERAVAGGADQHPVHRARLRQDLAQQPGAQHAPGQEPPPPGWHSKSNNKKRFENHTKILLLSN